MQLQQVTTTWTCRINTLLIVKSIGLDISCIIVAKIWSKWTTFFLVSSTQKYSSFVILGMEFIHGSFLGFGTSLDEFLGSIIGDLLWWYLRVITIK
jgi:hypothetical protein